MDEIERLDALASYNILDTSLKKGFNNVVGLAATLFDAPIALVSFVDTEHQWCEASVGLNLKEMSRNLAFCVHTILSDDVFVIPDASKDRRFSSNVLVTGKPGIRFYAGAPLQVNSGHRLGALCIMDTKPRPGLSDREQRALTGLAQTIVDHLETAKHNRAHLAMRNRFEQMLHASPAAIICADSVGRIISWNDAASALFGHSAKDALGEPLEIIIPERLRAGHKGGLSQAAASGESRLAGTAVETIGLHQDGHEIPVEISLSMWRENGKPTFGAIVRDITKRHKNQERLHRLAHYDPLTGLSNRHSFQEHVQAAITRLNGGHPAPMGLLLLDLDGFKDVNDSLGHSAGDKLLCESAHRLQQAIERIGSVARLGGDEFAILLENIVDPLVISEIAQRIIGSIGEPFEINGQLSHLGASIGIALYPAHGQNAEQLLSNADLALYQTKVEGGSSYQFFVPEMAQKVQTRLALENELRRGLVDQQFELFFQPQVRLQDNVIVGAEALLRWRHPERGLLAPADFLSVLENGPLASDVGNWVIATACQQAAQWQALGLPALRVGINLFRAQLRNGRLVDIVKHVLVESGLQPDLLELEITENIVLKQDESMIEPLKALRALGVGIAFDDFGTGFASLSLLKRFPLNRLKIDRSFVRGVAENANDMAIVSAVLAIAQSLAFDVVAEGIETPMQSKHLAKLGCAEGQGYLYGKPMPAAEFINLVEQHQAEAAA